MLEKEEVEDIEDFAEDDEEYDEDLKQSGLARLVCDERNTFNKKIEQKVQKIL